MEQLADVVPMVQLLDSPGLQRGEVLRKFDVPSVEQVIAVPMISLDGVPQRSALRRVRRRRNSWWKCRRSPDVHWRSLPCRPWGGGQQRHWRSMSWTVQFLKFGRRCEVFKVHEHDRVQQQRTWSRSFTFQFLRVSEGEVEVLKVLSQYRIQQRMWSRSLIFLLVEVAKVVSQARVPHRVDFFKMRMKDFKGFFALFPGPQKCGGHPPVESESARQCQLMRAELSPNGLCRGV